MITNKKVLAVITARGGSKGLPRKNILDLCGKPLIAWTIHAAKKSKYIDRLILSSESSEIIEVAKKYGCEAPFLRPQELAEDKSSSIDVLTHALSSVPGFDYVVLLQPTSPFRTAEDIDACVEACIQQRSPACVSVAKTEKSPYWMFTRDDKDHLKPVVESRYLDSRRQDCPETFALNGAVYVARIEWIIKNRSFISDETVSCVMPSERSIDIDTATDLIVAKVLFEQGLSSFK